MKPLLIGEKTIHFLSIVPLYGDELDYKMSKGTQKTIRRFLAKKIDERLDNYRVSIMRSRMRFW